MLKNAVANRAILVHGGFVFSENQCVVAFGENLNALPAGSPSGYTFKTGAINISSIDIEQLSTYDRFVVLGYSLDETDGSSDISDGSLGLWYLSKRGWKLHSSPYRYDGVFQDKIRELLSEHKIRSDIGVRVTAPRNTDQRKIERLATICGLTDCRWEFNEDGDEAYLSYEYPNRNFNPYHDDFWVWEMAQRAGLSVENQGGRVMKFIHPDTRFTFQQSNTSYRALRTELCDWLLDTTNRIEKGMGARESQY